MGADQTNFSIRYREKNSIFDLPRREEIEKFIIDYSTEVGIDAEEGTHSVHFPHYSEVTFYTCYGPIGKFLGLPADMVENYPDIEFEFHYTEWYGDVTDSVMIYDGEQMHHRSWEIVPEDFEEDEEDDEEQEELTEEDPFHAPRYWRIGEYDDFMEPHFLYIN